LGVEARIRFLGSGVDSRGKKGRKGPEGQEVGSGAGIEIEEKTSSRQGELAKLRLAGLQWQRKYAGWGLLHMFCAAAQHCMIHHTVHKKVNHSTAASQERTPAKLPAVPGLPAGQICWRAPWASWARVEDLPDHDHTVWEVKELATAKQPTWLLLL